jgi:hypothetical protein
MSHVRYLWLFAYSGVQHILHDHIVSLKGQIWVHKSIITQPLLYILVFILLVLVKSVKNNVLKKQYTKLIFFLNL